MRSEQIRFSAAAMLLRVGSNGLYHIYGRYRFVDMLFHNSIMMPVLGPHANVIHDDHSIAPAVDSISAL